MRLLRIAAIGFLLLTGCGRSFLASNASSLGEGYTCAKGAAYMDGCAGAPKGVPQFSTLLSGYRARAPWNVAGVEYAVGITAGTPLKDPGTADLPAGTKRDTASQLVYVSGNDVVLDGWDFSLNGGWGVAITGNNATIQNCNFKVGANAQVPITTGGATVNGVTIRNNVIDGSGMATSPSNVGLIWLFDSGTTTIEYNLIENVYATAIQEGPSVATGSANNAAQIIRFNVIANTGRALVEDFGIATTGSQTFQDVRIEFNTFIESSASSGGNGLSVVTSGVNQNCSVQKESIQNNTAVFSVSPPNIAYGFAIIDTSWLNGAATLANNYLDTSGAQNGWAFIGKFSGSPGPYSGTVTQANNFDMRSGNPLPAP